MNVVEFMVWGMILIPVVAMLIFGLWYVGLRRRFVPKLKWRNLAAAYLIVYLLIYGWSAMQGLIYRIENPPVSRIEISRPAFPDGEHFVIHSDGYIKFSQYGGNFEAKADALLFRKIFDILSSQMAYGKKSRMLGRFAFSCGQNHPAISNVKWVFGSGTFLESPTMVICGGPIEYVADLPNFPLELIGLRPDIGARAVLRSRSDAVEEICATVPKASWKFLPDATNDVIDNEIRDKHSPC
jgi:hypothetical protein